MNENTDIESLRRDLRRLEQELADVKKTRRQRWLLAAAAVVLTSTIASAQLVTFTADSPARALDVNNNFTFLNTRITNEINQLRTQLETKTGSVSLNYVNAVNGLSMNNLRITNAGVPAAGNGGNNDVVTKGHLKAIFANTVVYVTGANCPAGFSAYAAAEGRFIRGDGSGDQGVGGTDSVGVNYGVANIAAAPGGSGGPFLWWMTVGGQGNGGAFSIVPGHVRLKPCIFNGNY